MIKLIAALAFIGTGTLTFVIIERPKPETPLVRWMAANGAGDVREASGADIGIWIGQHRQLLDPLLTQCKQTRPAADSPDMRICTAAAGVQYFSYHEQRDKTTFGGGWK